ncbi:MAG TPA: type I-F CRISPR-associated endoribonuclease Cas6/Csy4 [Thiotrichales bacterium]|nr:type I-F CRISPR-associated endoribonuclease Cas6/Csy4 [Thiotrichales bacterium]
MDSYIDIRFMEDDEIPIYFIRNKTFTKLHKALHDQKQTVIGVSFPNYKVKLGDTIRLHGNKPALDTLQQSNWLGGLAGYCDVGEILPVPENIEGYRTVSRKQPTMTLKKMQVRIAYQKQQGILKTAEDIKAYERQYKEKMYGSQSLDNPYLELKSSSNGQLYRVFIEMGEIQDKSVSGDFNYFGLSKIATVPWF